MRKWAVTISWFQDGAQQKAERQYELDENWRLYLLLLRENLIPSSPHKIEVVEVFV